MYSTYGGERVLSTSRLTMVLSEHIGSTNLVTTSGRHLAHAHICCAVSKSMMSRPSSESESQTYLILRNTLEDSRGTVPLHRFSETRPGFGDGEGTLQDAEQRALLEAVLADEIGLVVEFVGEERAGCDGISSVLLSCPSLGSQYLSKSILLPTPDRSAQCVLSHGVAQWKGCPPSSTRLGRGRNCRFRLGVPWPEFGYSGPGHRRGHRSPRAPIRRGTGR